MLPSVLAACSPPRGVSSAPRRAASSGLTAPKAAGAHSSAAAANRIRVFIAALHYSRARAGPRGWSKRVFDTGRNEIAIVGEVVLAGATVLCIGHVEVPLGAQARTEAHAERMTALDEVTARTGGAPLHVMAPGEMRQPVQCAESVVVLEPAGDDVAPGELVGKRVAGLHQGGKLRIAAETGIAAQVRAGAVVAQTATDRPTVELILEARDVIGRGLEQQHRLGGLQHVGEHLRGGELSLPGVLELPAADDLAEPKGAELVAPGDRSHALDTHAWRAHRLAEQPRDPRLEGRERCVDELDVIELQRHVVTERDLPLQRGAGLL